MAKQSLPLLWKLKAVYGGSGMAMPKESGKSKMFEWASHSSVTALAISRY
jgi:hypothetical protein